MANQNVSGNVGDKGYVEVRNEYGRVFRVGETPKQLLGYPRMVVIIAAWVAMMLAGLLEYTWGALSGDFAAGHHWGLGEIGWLFSVYVIFESFIQILTGTLRSRGILPVRWAVILGGIICGIAAYGWFSVLPNGPVGAFEAFLSYAVLGGIGSGMVYSSAINIVAKWYPEKKGWRTGFVNGGWAYGAVPFIIGLGAATTAGGAPNLPLGNPLNFFGTANGYVLFQGICMTIGIGLAGIFMKDPPKNWWPKEIDPLNWHKKSTRDLLHNPPALKHYSLREMWATKQAKWIGIQYALFIGSSLFGVAFYYPFAQAMGLGTVAAIAGAAGFALTDGVCRPFYGLLSEFIGRKNTMSFGYSMNFIFQLGALASGLAHNAPAFVVSAIISGGFSGTNFPMTAALVADYYGETNNAVNYGSIYAFKALGGSFASGIAGIVMTGTVFATATPTTSEWIRGFIFGALLALAAALVITFLVRRPTPEDLKAAEAKVAARARKMAVKTGEQ
jgi:OFA family oxalate/formate antiporter-like MFS transporter